MEFKISVTKMKKLLKRISSSFELVEIKVIEDEDGLRITM